MKQFLEYIPLFVLLIVNKMEQRIIHIGSFEYEFGGFFSATELMIVTALICYGIVTIAQRHLTRMQIFTVAAICIFGGMALYFRNDTFLKWKAPIVYWIFAAIFIGNQLFTPKTLLEKMFNQAADVPFFLAPEHLWKRLNLYWVVFFVLMGVANLYIAFNFENWIDFKVIGGMVMTFVMLLVTMISLWKYLNPEIEEKNTSKEEP